MELSILKLMNMLVVGVILLVQMARGSTCGNCTCSSSSVTCNYKSLTSVPSFDPAAITSVTNIYLYGNRITTIGDKAFISFQNNSRVIYINLDNNLISNVSENAFVGLENITTLYLQSNRLSTLPHALQNLSHLQQLYLYGNPLVSLDPRVMSVLGNTLLTLQVDLQHMFHWPNELHFLRHLQTLTLHHLNETHLVREMFHGLEGSLQSLEFYYTQLQSVSSVICDLQSLRTLRVENSPNLNESNHAVFEPCKGHLSHVTNLNLNNNPKMTVFPVLGSTFLSIQSLSFQNNNMKFMNADSVAHAQSVTTLYLNGNKFTHIPYAISKFSHLTSLYLHSNLITDIEDPDFAHLTHLQYLELQYNPLVYISNNAFRHNVDLRRIRLDNTQLHQLPTSLKLLPDLSSLHLSNTFVECTCDLANLKGWNVGSINFYNNPLKCYQSSLLLKDFIQNDLQNC